jgi:hypothetical protein
VIQLLGVWRLEGDVILAMPYLPHVRYGTIPYDAVGGVARVCYLMSVKEEVRERRKCDRKMNKEEK